MNLNEIFPTMYDLNMIAGLAMIVGIYFFPTIIAFLGHPNKIGVFIANLFFGWTVVGYLLILIWSFKRPERYIVEYKQPQVIYK